MSISELLVVIIIALLVMKPDDLINIYKIVKKLINYFSEYKQEILGEIDKALDKKDDILSREAEQLNLYLKTIVDQEGSYQGEYSLKALEKKYRSLHTADNTKQKIADFTNKTI